MGEGRSQHEFFYRAGVRLRAWIWRREGWSEDLQLAYLPPLPNCRHMLVNSVCVRLCACECARIHVCVCVHTCVCVCACVDMWLCTCAHAYGGKNWTSISFVACVLIAEKHSSHPTRVLPLRAVWLEGYLSESACFCLRTGVTGDHSCAQVFTWVLGIWIQIIMLAE